MHFEILIEDQSGKKALDIIAPKIIGDEHTCKVISYKGIGRLPKGLVGKTDPWKRILLDQLPLLLRAYGQTFSNYPTGYSAVLIVVCDLDNKCQKAFRAELIDVLNAIHPQPETCFCFAIEEGEAWLLGDLPAIIRAYPNANRTPLDSYVNDSICGTWETLADAVYPGGVIALRKNGWHAVGTEKARWADNISPSMDIENNESPSFCYFRDKIRLLASTDAGIQNR